MKTITGLSVSGLGAAFALAATPALAHHPLAGAPMETFAHGILSGIGHPLLGIDHLFFVVAVGIAAALLGRLASAPFAYIAGMTGGIALLAGGMVLPGVELVIAASLIVLGGLLASGARLTAPLVLGLFAIAGLFHGWAFGGALAGQEGGVGGAVFAGYLIGLAVTQYAVAYLAGRFLATADGLRARLGGAVVAGVGAAFFLEQVEGLAFSALGLG